MTPEALRRRDDFDAAGAVWIELADGQAWGFPRPWLAVRALFRGGKAETTALAYSYGPRADALAAAIAECEDDAVRMSGVATLAAIVLRGHYELTDAELDGLLAFRPADSGSMGWLVAVMELVAGRHGFRQERGG